MERVETGSRTLDAALAGGLPEGAALLVTGEEGAGATEFALTFLRHGISTKRSEHARFLSALRSPKRVRAELVALFEDPTGADGIEVRHADPATLREQPTRELDGLGKGDLLIIESADALAPAGDGLVMPPWWRALADGANERGIVVLLLHSPGTLPAAVEAALAEAADGVLQFRWHDSGASRRRVLALVKLRGLAPILDGGEVPVFEVTLHRGVGFGISRGRSVL